MSKFLEMNEGQKEMIFNWLTKEFKRINTFYDYKKVAKQFNDLIGEMLKDEKYNKKIKKLLCVILKDMYRYYQEEEQFFRGIKRVVNQGLQSDEDGSSWNYWYIIKGDTEEEVSRFIDKYGRDFGIYLEGIEIHSAYDCTGQTFAWDMNIRKVGQGLFLATKHFGIDC